MAVRKTKKKNNKKHSILKYELQLLILIAFTVILVFSLHTDSIGIVGEYVKKVIFGLFSKTAYFSPYVIFVIIFVRINHNLEEVKLKYTIAAISFFLGVLLFVGTLNYDFALESFLLNNINIFSINGIKESYVNGIILSGGGAIGNLFVFFIVKALGKLGAYVLTLAFISCTIVLGTRVSITEMINKKKEKSILNINNSKKIVNKKIKENSKVKSAENINENAKLNIKKCKNRKFDEFNSDSYIEKSHIKKDDGKKDNFEEIKFNNFIDNKIEEEKPAKISRDKGSNKKINPAESKLIEKVITESIDSEYKNYVLPKLSLLNKSKNSGKTENRNDIIEKAKILEQTLKNFGVDAKVVQVNKGPAITMYELQPSPGVKVSKIVNLSDDIALNLAAQQVRIIAPIPGKAAVGIEIPNDNTTMVNLRDVIETREFSKSKSKLSFVVGKDISGNPVIGDLGKMPHLLIAGATGSGKSVCVNTLILSILFNASPDEVKFLMIDPKVVELSNYNGIPHLMLPVVTDPKKAAIALNWAVQEMVRRYQLFADNQVKDLTSYSKKLEKHKDSEEKLEKLPQMVIVIDELADLMMVAANQVEDAICRLAQMARAAGMHLIVATQRPSVDVITGVIKANIPSRIAFAVSSQVDSRTIIDMGGAEKLLGKGDMLYYPVGKSKPIRIQGSFVLDQEIEDVVEFVKSQGKEVKYNEDILNAVPAKPFSSDSDEYMKDAIEFVVNSKQASVSMIQRKFRVGYNRAARMIDSMEERGIVGPSKGSKSRDVLMTLAELSGEEES